MTKEIVSWADRAMFSAEPMVDQKPKVYLISMNPDPLGSIAAAAKMYKGEVCRDLSDVTDAERVQYFEDGTKTVLGAPFETVQFHFLIEGVTRGFTHQLVRQRTATYFQESTRFAVIDETFSDRVGLPPSLDGTVSVDDFWGEIERTGLDAEANTTRTQRWRLIWDEAIEAIEGAYKALVADGMPAEDARGLLPTNLLTRVHYRTNLRDLIAHAGNRLCTQAQFEWRYVFNEIIGAIKTAEVHMPFVDIGSGDGSDAERGEMVAPVYMREQLASLFQPVCYQQGKCGFKASFDRACSIRDRVDKNAEQGRPSSQWHLPLVSANGLKDVGPIYPAEWAMDASAARS